MKYIIPILLVFLSCEKKCETYDHDSILMNPKYHEKLISERDYDYYIKTFRIRDNCKKLLFLGFYKNGLLIEFLRGESHYQYSYDSGKLISKKECKFRNCDSENLNIEFFNYNEFNQKTGSYITSYSSKSTKQNEKLRQTLFYDNYGRIIKEFIRNGTTPTRGKFEVWKYFEYPENTTQIEYKVIDTDTISKKIHKLNKNNEKIKTIINENNTSYVLKYEYDSQKRLVETQRLNVKEDTVYLRIINEITENN